MKPKNNDLSLFEKTELFFSKQHNVFLYITIGLSLLFSLLLFNPDVSVGGDDSAYIRAAFDFIHGIAFPSWHGSFYSITISLFTLIFGINIIALKFVSILFFVASLVFIQKAFVKLTNYTVATFIILATSVNFLLCSYAGTTYSEPYFFFLQALYIYLVVLFIEKNKANTINWWYMAILGILTYLIIQTRTVAAALFIATIIYFLIEKHYKNTLVYTLIVTLFHFLFNFYKSTLWEVNKVGFEDQIDSLILKHPYKANEGKEDLIGFIQRFWDNSELYLSKHLMIMTGFKPIDSRETSTLLTIFLFIAFLLASIVLIRKNKKLSFVVLFLTGMISATFLSVQKLWDQDRLIIVFFPYLLGVFSYTIYLTFTKKKLVKLQSLPILLSILMFIAIILQSTNEFKKTSYKHKFKSGYYESYSTDWKNYMQACSWASSNLEEQAIVVCRKPGMAWIAGEGNNIYKGLFAIKYANVDSINNFYRTVGATHVIMANLRLHPNKKTDRTISTIKNSLIFFYNKQRGRLKLIKEFGDDEKAYLFEIIPRERLTETEYINNLDSEILINPIDRVTYTLKGNYYYKLGEYEIALKYFEMPLRYHKDDPKIYYNIASCELMMMKNQEALDNLMKSVKIDPDLFNAWYNITIAYCNLKDKNNALKALSKCKELDKSRDVSSLVNDISKL